MGIMHVNVTVRNPADPARPTVRLKLKGLR